MTRETTLDLPVLGPTRIAVGERGVRRIELGLPADAPIGRVGGDPLLRRTVEVLRAWAAGRPIPDDLPVDLGDCTPFQRGILAACRAIPFGAVRSYGQLAAETGHPRAARAVGGCMARNPVPVIIPCHRVVGSTGVGGFSPGLELKRRMWAVEGLAWPE